MYAPVEGEPFPVPAVKLSDIDPAFLRKAVYYPTNEVPGTIVIDPQRHFLYLVQEGGRAIRYGVGVGRQGFGAGIPQRVGTRPSPPRNRNRQALRSRGRIRSSSQALDRREDNCVSGLSGGGDGI